MVTQGLIVAIILAAYAVELAIKPRTARIHIKYLIHKYPLNKSPDFDLITTEVARNLPKRAIAHLAYL